MKDTEISTLNLINLFHLSQDENISKLRPRVPIKAWPEHEDRYVERICFSDSINGCLRALFANDGVEYNIYVPKKFINVYRPSDKEVIDQEITHEVWATDEVPVINIGKILVLGGKCVDMYTKQEIELPKVDYTWILHKRMCCYAH